MFQGIRVLDFTHVLSGPYAAMLLGDLGAEVWKIEKPARGDTTRGTPPFINGVSHYFFSVNRQKKSVAVDVKTDAGRQLILDLLPHVDVVLNNFRPGVMEGLGLGYPDLQARNPRIISCSISGFGQTGPLRDRTAFDLITQAMSGFMSVTGEKGRPPIRTGVSIGDVTAGVFAVAAVSAALYRREREGVGANIDVSMLDSLISLLTYYVPLSAATGRAPEPEGSMHASVVPMGAFPTEDGFIAIAAFNQQFWRSLCVALDHPEWMEDPRFDTLAHRRAYRDELMPMIKAITSTATTAEWAKRFEARDVPYGPIQTIPEVLEHPQVQDRNMILRLSHPEAGEVPVANHPFHISALNNAPPLLPPSLGADTAAVLTSVLGLSAHQLSQLASEGVIGLGDPPKEAQE